MWNNIHGIIGALEGIRANLAMKISREIMVTRALSCKRVSADHTTFACIPIPLVVF